MGLNFWNYSAKAPQFEYENMVSIEFLIYLFFSPRFLSWINEHHEGHLNPAPTSSGSAALLSPSFPSSFSFSLSAVVSPSTFSSSSFSASFPFLSSSFSTGAGVAARRERKNNCGIRLRLHCYSLHRTPPAGDCEPLSWPTWLGGARRVVATGIGGGRGGLDLRRRRPGGGFVQADLRFELWEAPPAVDVFKLLNLWTPEDKAAWQRALMSFNQ